MLLVTGPWQGTAVYFLQSLPLHVSDQLGCLCFDYSNSSVAPDAGPDVFGQLVVSLLPLVAMVCLKNSTNWQSRTPHLHTFRIPGHVLCPCPISSTPTQVFSKHAGLREASCLLLMLMIMMKVLSTQGASFAIQPMYACVYASTPHPLDKPLPPSTESGLNLHVAAQPHFGSCTSEAELSAAGHRQ